MSAQEKESQARELALLKKELAQIKLSNAYILAVSAQAYYAKSPVLRWLWRCLARGDASNSSLAQIACGEGSSGRLGRFAQSI